MVAERGAGSTDGDIPITYLRGAAAATAAPTTSPPTGGAPPTLGPVAATSTTSTSGGMRAPVRGGQAGALFRRQGPAWQTLRH